MQIPHTEFTVVDEIALKINGVYFVHLFQQRYMLTHSHTWETGVLLSPCKLMHG